MSPYTVAWLAWIGFFFAIEVPAILDRRPGGTLSEHVWDWFAIKSKPTGYRSRRFVLVAFLAWLVGHFLTGGAL
ncbi:MAG: hypothetical protein KJO36_08305 [Acidimicrobiia bacterium]|nr:hypothetical protein [Acidimicrobiia bacterium]